MADAIVRDGKVQMLDRLGVPIEVPQEQLDQAYAQGYRVEAPDALRAREIQEQGVTGIANEVTATAEGVARGLTLGFSDRALVGALGDEYRQRAEARADTTFGAAGEVAGMVAPAVFSGGESLALKAALAPGRVIAGVGGAIAKAGGRGTLGRIAAGAAGAAVEGAAYSMGHANSEAALGGTELTAEKLLSAAGEGATWGAIGGGVVGAGTAAIGRAGRAVTERMLGEGTTLAKALSEHTAGTTARKIVGEGIDQATAARFGEKLRGAGVAESADAIGAVRAAAARADDAAQRITALADQAGVRVERKALDTTLDTARARAADLRKIPAREYQTAAKRIEAEIAPLAKRTEPLTLSEARAVSDSLAKIRGDGPLGDAIAATRKDLDAAIDAALDRPGADALHRAAAAGDETAATALREQRSLKDAWRQAQSDAQDWRQIDAMAAAKPSEGTAARLASAGHSTALGVLTGIATGHVAPAAAVALLGGRAMTAATEYVVNRGVAAVSRMAQRLASVEGRLDAAALSIVSGKVAPTVGAVAGAVGYDRLREQIAGVRDGSELTRVAAQFDDPDVAMAAMQKLLGDADYLERKLPVVFPHPSATQPDLPGTEPSPLDLQRMTAIATALNDPAGVAADLAAGHYDPDAIAAVRARRPELWDEMRDRVMVYAAAQGDAIPFERRTLLGLAFDFPADWSLDSANLTAIQGVGAPAGPSGEPHPGGGANINPTIGEAYALPSNPVSE